MEHVRKYFRSYLQEIKEKEIQERLHMMMELLYSSIVAGRVLDAPMHITGFNDYNLYYMSPSYMELSGYTEAEVSAGGFPFLYEIIHPEDLVYIKQLKENLSSNKLAPFHNESQSDYSVHFNYRIYHKDGTLIHLECRMLPVGFFKDKPNFLLSYVRKTEEKFKRKFEIHFFSKQTCYVFDTYTGKFVLQERKMLKEIELHILKLVSRGARESTMVKQTGLDINMIKYHKKNIMKKLSVQSMNEALYYALKNNIL
ncbi:MAG: PAS domain-containing protein [Tannerellaceae bacterium]